MKEGRGRTKTKNTEKIQLSRRGEIGGDGEGVKEGEIKQSEKEANKAYKLLFINIQPQSLNDLEAS